MNQHTQVGSSNPQQLLPPKRKRGRPRKDPTLKRIAMAPIPPGFGIKEHKSHQAGSNDATDSGIIGQAVTGVIEAAFDGGYLLTVRIGNSNTSLRGVVFKPGSFIPVTAGNDVAPQVQMIKRNELDGGRSESNGGALPPLNQGPRILPQSTTAMVTTKGRHVSPTGSSSHLGDGRGTLVPVVLQPITVSALNGSSSVNHALPEPSVVSRDKDVVTAEPLAMVLPERPPSSSSQFRAAAKNEQLAPTASMQNAKEARHHASASNLAAVHDKEETEGLKQGNVPTTSVESMTVVQGTNSKLSSPASHVHSLYTPMSFKNYGTGRMSELLQAVQENVKPFAVAGVEYHELQNPN